MNINKGSVKLSGSHVVASTLFTGSAIAAGAIAYTGYTSDCSFISVGVHCTTLATAAVTVKVHPIINGDISTAADAVTTLLSSKACGNSRISTAQHAVTVPSGQIAVQNNEAAQQTFNAFLYKHYRARG